MTLLGNIAHAFSKIGYPALVITASPPLLTLQVENLREHGTVKELRQIGLRLYARLKNKATTKQEHNDASRIP